MLFPQKSLLLLPLLGLSAFAQTLAELPSADKVLDRFVEASGGQEAFSKVKTVSMTGVMEIKAQGVRAAMKMYRANGGKSYTVFELPGMGKQEDGSDGTTVWDKTVLGPRIKSGTEKFLASCAKSAIGTEYAPSAVDMASCYDKITVTGIEDLDGKPAFKLLLSPKQGKPQEQWFDKESGLLKKLRMTMPSPMGELPMNVIFDEYKAIDGILTPVRMTNQMGPLSMTLSFSEILYNPEIPEQTFALPADIQALLNAEKNAVKKTPAKK
jgi:zinc protease